MSADVSLLTDHELLSQYVKAKSGQAFNVLVNRYVDLVYTAAMRQVRDAHLAEDVTQAVFLILSQRARNITSQVVIPGWLLITARNCSRNALVRERRLKDREWKAANMKPEEINQHAEADAEAISPILDEALSNLNEEDRNAIVNRFFLSKSHREVGEVLGVSEDAASQRVIRAIDKMRDFLARHGVKTSHAALSAALPLIAVKSAPPTLVATVTGGMMGASSAVAAIAKPVLGGKTVTAAVIGWAAAGVIAVTATVGVIVVQNTKSNPPVATTTQPAPVGTLDVRANANLNPPPAPVIVATKLTVTVIDPKTKKPLAGAEVQYSNGNVNDNNWVKTDFAGKAILPIPDPNAYSQIYARSPGRVQSRVTMSPSPIRGDFPGELEFPLPVGIVIGGTVVDENDQPIPEAQVQFSFSTSQQEINTPQPNLQNIKVITDSQGHWTFEQAPAELDRLYIYANHPSLRNLESNYARNNDDLKNDQAKIVMKKSAQEAFTKTGDVVDEAGKPIVGAKVTWYYSKNDSNKPTGITDDKGHFTLSATYNSGNPITAQAKGYGPVVLSYEEAQKSTLNIVMKKSRKVEGTIHDESGKPLKGANISLGRIGKGSNVPNFIWSAKTNADGHWQWDEAPADEFEVSVYLSKRSSLDRAMVSADSNSVDLTMFPELPVEGTVIDADTKQPIQKFTMDYGICWTAQSDVTWQQQNGREIANGKYNANLIDFNNGGKLRVNAEGYLPSMSRMIYAKEGVAGKVVVNFELKKGSGPTGTIVSTDGKPLEDVDVAIMPRDSGYSINLDEPMRNIRDYSNCFVTKTDAKGQYKFKPVTGEYKLMAASDQGILITNDFDPAKTQQFKLQAWGSIEGTAKCNASVGKDMELSMNYQPTGSGQTYFYGSSIKSDGEGKFSFNRCCPGTYTIGRTYRSSDGRSSFSADAGTAIVGAGEKVTMNIGGVGRPVTGKLNVPKEIADKVALGNNLFMLNATSQSRPAPTFNPYTAVEYPSDYADWDTAQRKKWERDNLQKLKLAAMFKSMQNEVTYRSQLFVVGNDGTFKTDDMLPGNYTFDFDLYEPWEGGSERKSHGRIHGEFVVPETPACPTDEVLNVGEFGMQNGVAGPTPGAQAQFAPGESLPKISLMTLDGKPFDYDAYHGKTLVLHLWTLNLKNTLQEARQLEEQYRGDPGVAVVHVGYETLTPWAKRVAEREKWESLSVVGAAEFNKQYNAAEWVPWKCNYSAACYLVVDGNGKLVGSTIKPAEVDSLVKKAGSK